MSRNIDKGNRASIVLIVLFSMILIVSIAIFGDKGVLEVYQMKQRLDDLEEANRKLAEENRELIDQIERLQNDPREVERIARDELGLVGDDEIIYRFSEKTDPSESEKADEREEPEG